MQGDGVSSAWMPSSWSWSTEANGSWLIGHPVMIDGVDDVIWEQGRRNFSLRADEPLSIVCPVRDGNDMCCIGVSPLTPRKWHPAWTTIRASRRACSATRSIPVAACRGMLFARGPFRRVQELAESAINGLTPGGVG